MANKMYLVLDVRCLFVFFFKEREEVKCSDTKTENHQKTQLCRGKSILKQ